MYGPVLVGTKVTLRPPVDADAARFVEWFGDLEVTRYLLRRFGVGQLQEEARHLEIAEPFDEACGVGVIRRAKGHLRTHQHGTIHLRA